MKTICAGEVLNHGRSEFHSAAALDETNRLRITFHGVLRSTEYYRYLYRYFEDLKRSLPTLAITHITLDFEHFRFAADHTHYALMDIIDSIYDETSCPVLVRQLEDDEWQLEVLPLLLNLQEAPVSERTSFERVCAK